jgi:cytochrome b561
MNRLRSALSPNKRTFVKILHGVTIPLFIWFMLVTPDDVNSIGRWAFHLHSFLGLVFVTSALIWTVMYLRRGLVGKPGPKLGPRAKRTHQTLHKILIWGLFGVALTGFGLGITSATQLWAGSIVPIGVPLNLPASNGLVGQIHTFEFYLLGVIVLFHAGFHIWRHVKLRDNALRIMAPKAFHRFL